MVKKQRRVLKSTQLAESSASQLCISAMLKTTEAQGVAERISILALNASGNGRNFTAKKANSGKRTSLPRQIVYTAGREKSFGRLTVDRRMPRMIIHSGVLICPRAFTPLTKRGGNPFDAPRR